MKAFYFDASNQFLVIGMGRQFNDTSSDVSTTETNAIETSSAELYSTGMYSTEKPSTEVYLTETSSTETSTISITSTTPTSITTTTASGLSPIERDLYMAYLLLDKNLQKLNVTVNELRQKFGSDIQSFIFPIRYSA